jgi:hypothetical protein
MPDRSIGDTAQIRLIMEQAAEAAIIQFTSQHPELKGADAAVPPIVKWLVGAIAGFGSAALIGLGFWLVTSVSQMQVTVARIDERLNSGSIKDARFEDIERRVSKNEARIAALSGEGGAR